MTREQADRVLAVYAFYSAIEEFDVKYLNGAGIGANAGQKAIVELSLLGEELDFDPDGITDDDFPLAEALALVFGGADGPQRS